jgi:hypothetical protein
MSGLNFAGNVVVACTVACLMAPPVQAQLKTTSIALGCIAPDNIPAAEEANKRHDRLKMDMLGCFPISTGTKAKRIEDIGNLWRVILDPTGPQPMEAWARPSSFQPD